MDIYSAESHVKRLLSYVEGIADEKPRMYEKSKNRLRDLADTCNQVVLVISEILQDEVLNDDREEFEDTNSDVVELLDSMEDQLIKLRQFTSSNPAETSSKSNQLNYRMDKKKIISEYRKWLMSASDNYLGCIYADECAEMLWTWFDTRFYKTISGSSFRYNMKKFPMWIRDFVVVYGKSVHDGSSEDFMNDFRHWISLIENTDARNKFAVPYPVYQFGKNVDSGMLTLESVVLWDMLLDKGLMNLCFLDNDLHLDEYCIYNLVGDKCPEELDKYVDYKHDPSILTLLGWRVGDMH